VPEKQNYTFGKKGKKALIIGPLHKSTNVEKSAENSVTIDNTVVLPYIPKSTENGKGKLPGKGAVRIINGEQKFAASDADKEFEIIKRCQQGNRVAFNELVHRHERKVFNLCFRILGNREEAEDVAQDVFVTVFRAIKSFRGDSAFSTWVYRVAVNNCKNRLKYLRRRGYFRTESMEQTFDDGEVEHQREYSDDKEDLPEEAMNRAELNAEIQTAIDGLDEEYREVIVLRDVQGFSYEEISGILQLKEGTVKSRIHRARMELQRKLGHLIS